MNKKKIAVLGGSFDPIHKGHLQIAKQAVAMGMDEVWFMPTYDTPLKDRNLTHSTHRLEMIKRAIAPYRRFHCCCIEIEREGKSYTIDTVRTLKREYPDADFYWLIGSDQANQIDAWKEPKELTSLVQFIVFSRRGAQQESPYPLLYQPMELVDVSSSEIRAGKKWNYLVPGVRRYIAEHSLYLESFVEGHLSKKRYEHCVRVAQLAQELAAAHHYDERIAWQIGMLHDLCKEMKKEDLYVWMKLYFHHLCEEAPAVWHGYVGSILVKRLYGIRDSRVLNAIYHHVKGESSNPYAMIIFCADKLERGRNYDTSEQIALCKESLKAGFERVHREQSAYLKKEKAVQ